MTVGFEAFKTPNKPTNQATECVSRNVYKPAHLTTPAWSNWSTPQAGERVIRDATSVTSRHHHHLSHHARTVKQKQHLLVLTQRLLPSDQAAVNIESTFQQDNC